MMKRTIYHIEFAKTGLGISGGEICTIENIKYFKKKGLNQILLTTDNGKITYEKLGLLEDDKFKYRIINSWEEEQKEHIFLNYIKRLPKIRKLINNIKINDNDVVICHSDFFPNFIPTYWLWKKNKNIKILWWFHMKAPSIFRGYKGEFTGKFNIPDIRLIYYNLSQKIYLWLVKKINNGTIITVNKYYNKYLEKKFFKTNIKVYILKSFGGEKVVTQKFLNNKKKYDGVYVMGNKINSLTQLPETTNGIIVEIWKDIIFDFGEIKKLSLQRELSVYKFVMQVYKKISSFYVEFLNYLKLI